jgi:hypothetical protein
MMKVMLAYGHGDQKTIKVKSKTRKEEEEGNLFASSRRKSLEGKSYGRWCPKNL